MLHGAQSVSVSHAFRDFLAEISGLDDHALLTTLTEKFLNPATLYGFIEEVLQLLEESPDTIIPFSVFVDRGLKSLVIHQDRRVHFSIAILTPDHESVTTTGPQIVSFTQGWSRLHFVSLKSRGFEGDLTLATAKFYRRSAVMHDEGFCQLSRELNCEDGSNFEIENASECLVFERIFRPFIMLRLLVRNNGVDHAFEHEVKTGKQVRVRQTREDHGRIQMLMSLLRNLGRNDAIPVIVKMLPELTPHLRWQAMRECMALDAFAGMDLFRHQTLCDADDRIRNLSRVTVKQLEAKYGDALPRSMSV